MGITSDPGTGGTMSTFDIPVRCILLPDPVKEGLDLLQVADNARKLHAGVKLKPVVVRWMGETHDYEAAPNEPIYRITNGRHRFLAYVLSGRQMVTVTEEES